MCGRGDSVYVGGGCGALIEKATIPVRFVWFSGRKHLARSSSQRSRGQRRQVVVVVVVVACVVGVGAVTSPPCYGINSASVREEAVNFRSLPPPAL